MENNKDYFVRMRELKKEILPEFSSIIDLLQIKYSLLAHNSDFLMFYNKRIFSNSVVLRPYITKVFLNLDDSEVWRYHKLLLAIVECVNISTYQSNVVLDSKDDQINKKSNNFIISSFFTHFSVNDAIQLSSYSSEDKLFILNSITECLQELYYGQYLDTNVLTFSNGDLIANNADFQATYKRRCEYIGGSLILMCAKLAIHFNPKLNEIRNELESVASSFGLAGQIINDLGDLVDEGRIYSTQRFSDIKNERLTLPIIIANELFNCGLIKNNLIQVMENEKMIALLKEKISTEIIKPYIVLINEKIKIIRDKGFNPSELSLVMNLLTKSSYIIN